MKAQRDNSTKPKLKKAIHKGVVANFEDKKKLEKWRMKLQVKSILKRKKKLLALRY